MAKKDRTKRQPKQRWSIRSLVALMILLVVMIAVAISVTGRGEKPVTQHPIATPAEHVMSTPDQQIFLTLASNHPSQAVRNIVPLLETGELRFATHLVLPTGQEIPVPNIMYVPDMKAIIATPFFLTSPRVPPCVRTIALRHEVKHVEDDFAGMHSVPLSVGDGDESYWRDLLERVLHSEWRAGLAERELAKISCPYLEHWKLSGEELCRNFKRQMLKDGQHFPPEIFSRYPALKRRLESVNCDELAGPF